MCINVDIHHRTAAQDICWYIYDIHLFNLSILPLSNLARLSKYMHTGQTLVVRLKYQRDIIYELFIIRSSSRVGWPWTF